MAAFFLKSQFSAAAVVWVMTTGVGSCDQERSGWLQWLRVSGHQEHEERALSRRQDVNYQSWPQAQSQLTRVWEQLSTGTQGPARLTVAQKPGQLTNQ